MFNSLSQLRKTFSTQLAKSKQSQKTSQRGAGSHAFQTFAVFPSPTRQRQQGSGLSKDPGETNIQPGNPDFQTALNPNFPVSHTSRWTFSTGYMAKCVGDTTDFRREQKLAAVAALTNQGNIGCGTGRWPRDPTAVFEECPRSWWGFLLCLTMVRSPPLH